MKYIFLLLILISSSTFSQNKEKTPIELKLDSAINKLNQIKANTQGKQESVSLEIKNLEKIFKEKEVNWWEEYSSGLIALITIAVSSFSAYVIAARQIKQNKEQMNESSRIALAQVKENNISSARIQWIQELRPLLANLISNASLFSSSSLELKNYFDKSKESDLTKSEKEELVKLHHGTMEKLDLIQLDYNQIKLFLNKDEKAHKDLDTVIHNYIMMAGAKSLGKEIEIEVNEDQLIDKSRTVLKNAWEQAKNIS